MRRMALIAAAVAVTLVVAGPAAASYKAKVAGGKLTLTGNSKGDKLTLKLKKGKKSTLQIDVGSNGSVEFAFARSLFTSIVVNAGGGNDSVTISEKNGAFTTEEATRLNGGLGNDKLTGGSGPETILGAGGNDTLKGNIGADQVEGGKGKDSLFLGRGTDAAVWRPGDGNDVIDGQADLDTLSVTGSTAAEAFTFTAGSGKVLLKRSIDAVTLSADGLEAIVLTTLGGADSATVGDLSTTDLTTADVELGVAGVGDAAADQVTVEGTSGVDVIQAVAVGGGLQVNGLSAQVIVTGSEPANDRLTVRGLGGGDTLSGGAGLAALMQLTLDGGDGNDTLNGGNGADTLLGGDGTDTIDGNQGNDTAFLGAGNDTFIWDPGDGSDIVEGQDGGDTLHFNGSAGAEIFAASSNGGRLLFTRNVGNIVMDTDDVEILDLNTLGGSDTATVNDLAATDVAFVNVDLGVNGLGDAAVDALTVNGTVGVDVMSLAGSAGTVTVNTTSVAVSILRAEPANDTLTVNVSSGADLVSASGLAQTSLFHLTLNGGNDNDILVGSSGADTLNGDAGTGDYCDGGAGIDIGTTCETSINIP